MNQKAADTTIPALGNSFPKSPRFLNPNKSSQPSSYEPDALPGCCLNVQRNRCPTGYGTVGSANTCLCQAIGSLAYTPTNLFEYRNASLKTFSRGKAPISSIDVTQASKFLILTDSLIRFARHYHPKICCYAIRIIKQGIDDHPIDQLCDLELSIQFLVIRGIVAPKNMINCKLRISSTFWALEKLCQSSAIKPFITRFFRFRVDQQTLIP